MRAIALMMNAAAIAGLAACSSGEPRLMNLKAGGTGPDEFAILPTRPLSMPPDLALLPAPTPGGSNITDPAPMADAVAALGGNPAALADQGVGAADQALVAHASRRGTDPGIREELAQSDARWRQSNPRRPLERLFGTNAYQRAYRPMRLDNHAEQDRWQRAGARTPAAPPASE